MQIAKEIDAKFAGRSSLPVESDLQTYDRLQKEARERGQKFPSIGQMGIKL